MAILVVVEEPGAAPTAAVFRPRSGTPRGRIMLRLSKVGVLSELGWFDFRCRGLAQSAKHPVWALRPQFQPTAQPNHPTKPRLTPEQGHYDALLARDGDGAAAFERLAASLPPTPLDASTLRGGGRGAGRRGSGGAGRGRVQPMAAEEAIALLQSSRGRGRGAGRGRGRGAAPQPQPPAPAPQAGELEAAPLPVGVWGLGRGAGAWIGCSLKGLPHLPAVPRQRPQQPAQGGAAADPGQVGGAGPCLSWSGGARRPVWCAPSRLWPPPGARRSGPEARPGQLSRRRSKKLHNSPLRPSHFQTTPPLHFSAALCGGCRDAGALCCVLLGGRGALGLFGC